MTTGRVWDIQSKLSTLQWKQTKANRNFKINCVPVIALTKYVNQRECDVLIKILKVNNLRRCERPTRGFAHEMYGVIPKAKDLQLLRDFHQLLIWCNLRNDQDFECINVKIREKHYFKYSNYSRRFVRLCLFYNVGFYDRFYLHSRPALNITEKITWPSKNQTHGPWSRTLYEPSCTSTYGLWW